MKVTRSVQQQQRRAFCAVCFVLSKLLLSTFGCGTHIHLLTGKRTRAWSGQASEEHEPPGRAYRSLRGWSPIEIFLACELFYLVSSLKVWEESSSLPLWHAWSDTHPLLGSLLCYLPGVVHLPLLLCLRDPRGSDACSLALRLWVRAPLPCLHHGLHRGWTATSLKELSASCGCQVLRKAYRSW